MDLSVLTAKVNAISSTAESAAVTLKTLADEIRATAGNQTAANALADKLDAENTSLSTAIANTSDVMPAPGTGTE